MAYCSYCAGVLDAGQTLCPRCGHGAPVAVTTGRPSSLRGAFVLLIISCAFSILGFARFLVMPTMLTRMPPLFFARTIGFWVVWVILTILVWQRQNWARFAILVLLIWSLGNMMLTATRFTPSIFALAFPLFIDLIRAVATILLFQAATTAWFKKS